MDRNYLELAQSLLTTGEYPAIATHDERIIDAVETFRHNARQSRGTGSSSRCSTASAAICSAGSSQEGYRLRLYIPFGEAWYPYFMRRLAERPANLLFFARNLVRS